MAVLACLYYDLFLFLFCNSYFVVAVVAVVVAVLVLILYQELRLLVYNVGSLCNWRNCSIYT